MKIRKGDETGGVPFCRHQSQQAPGDSHSSRKSEQTKKQCL
ncbi:hypothetical protein M072_4337 [Bacteroides fragilis str. DS-208]|nr:hypothetical protein M072_4337 [Bacteroides fragilis str. DS-208]